MRTWEGGAAQKLEGRSGKTADDSGASRGTIVLMRVKSI